jgi:hypothetical protein
MGKTTVEDFVPTQENIADIAGMTLHLKKQLDITHETIKVMQQYDYSQDKEIESMHKMIECLQGEINCLNKMIKIIYKRINWEDEDGQD